MIFEGGFQYFEHVGYLTSLFTFIEKKNEINK